MGNFLDERYIEITVDEYKKLLGSEIRLDIIIQSLEQNDYVNKDEIMLFAKNAKCKRKKEEE